MEFHRTAFYDPILISTEPYPIPSSRLLPLPIEAAKFLPFSPFLRPNTIPIGSFRPLLARGHYPIWEDYLYHIAAYRANNSISFYFPFLFAGLSPCFAQEIGIPLFPLTILLC